MSRFGSMSIYERRRMFIAVVVTLVALPTLWWSKRDAPIASAGVAAVDVGGGLSVGTAQAADIADVGSPPGYLSGPDDSAPPLLAEPTGPPLEDSFTRGGLATYKTFPRGATTTATDSDSGSSENLALPARLCEVAFLPNGLRITVENTDNGKRVECQVSRTRLPEGTLLVIDSSLFVELSDLAEAPIPVRIRW